MKTLFESGAKNGGRSKVSCPQMDLTQKYLFCDLKNCTGGLDDHLYGLANLISVSFSLGRILVISEFNTRPIHNFNLPTKLVKFQDYVDLSKTLIFKATSKGRIEQVASSMQWISEQDFDMHSFSKEQIIHVSFLAGNITVQGKDSITDIFDEHLNQYRVIYVQAKTISVPLEVGGAPSPRALLHKRLFPFRIFKPKLVSAKWAISMLRRSSLTLCKKDHIYLPVLQPSQVVENLTDVVLNHFGVNRAEIVELKKHLMVNYRSTQIRILSSLKKAGCFYACLHLRTAHTLYRSPLYYFSSLRWQIKRTVRAARLPRGSKLYIMSDIHNPKYFNFLRSNSNYQVYTYHDFPELKQLVSGDDNSVDNYMLYSVEKNIMKHALIQIVPPGSNFFTFPLNVLYGLPTWVKVWHGLYRIYIRFKVYISRSGLSPKL